MTVGHLSEKVDSMDILGQSSLWVCLSSLALGLSALARNVRNTLYVAFAVMCGVITFWALFFSLEKIWPGVGWYRWHLFFSIWIGPSSLTFVQVLTRKSAALSKRIFEFSLLFAVVLTGLWVLRMDSISWVLNTIYFSPALLVFEVAHLMWEDRTLPRDFRQIAKLPVLGLTQRRHFIYIGGLLVLCTSVMDHVPSLGKVLPSFGNLGLTAYLFFISQAVTQQRVLNFGALFSRFLVLLVVALTLTGVYSLLVAWIQNSPGLFFLNSFIASFLILMLLDPLRTFVRVLTQTLLSKKYQKLEQSLLESQQRLTHVIDLGGLFQNLFGVIDQILAPEMSTLYLLRRDGSKFRKVRLPDRAEGLARDIPREVLVHHPLVEFCERQKKKGEIPVVLDALLEGELERLASRTQRAQLTILIQGLKSFQANLLIPLMDGDKVYGFVIFKNPTPPEPWGGDWGFLQILYPYFEAAAKALRNLDIFVRQREKERLAALGEMAAGLAHEIRNPLGAIKGAAQYLDPGVERSDSHFLRIIIEEVDRLNRVVTQFLDYSKPFSIEQKWVDLRELLVKTVDHMRPSLSTAVQLEVSLPESAESIGITGTPEQIQQVIINILQNGYRALEGRPAGQVRVSIELEGEALNREIFLSIEDNGPGIKKENLDKIFIPFFTTTSSGTGLGLSICSRIIEAHRGRIDVTSEEGRFARFTIVLPYAMKVEAK